MKRPELKPHLLSWLNANDGWHKKVDLYVIGDEIEFSPESTGRALRDLALENKIQVDYYNGRWVKGLAKYANIRTEKPIIAQPTIIERNGEYIAVY